MLPKDTRLYNWTDIEEFLYLLQKNNMWPQELKAVQVYLNEMELKINPGSDKETIDWLKDAFGNRFQEKSDKLSIALESLNDAPRLVNISISEIEEDLNEPPQVYRPTLNAPTVIRPTILKAAPEELPKEHPPIFAFHSFKGGVGRTLHALAMSQALTLTGAPKNILLIDGDMEAPGITWMLNERIPTPVISFSDFLTLIHTDTTQSALELIADRLQNSRLDQFYLLPAFRSSKQFGKLQVKPEHLTEWSDNPFIITDSLSKLGHMLNVKAVVIDLRAGLSEISAGIFLDPRVHRILVTTLSSQSVVGTVYLLKLINESVMRGKQYPSPKIIITQIPKDLYEDERPKLKSSIHKLENAGKALWSIEEPLGFKQSNFLLTFHEQNLIVLEEMWHNVMKTVQGSELFRRTKSWIEYTGFLKSENEDSMEPSEVTQCQKCLLSIIDTLLSDQLIEIINLFPLSISENLANDYRKSIPIVLIAGSQGAGKTMLFLEMIRLKKWEKFLENSGITERDVTKAIIFPVLCPREIRSAGKNVISESRQEVNLYIGYNDLISNEGMIDFLLHEFENSVDLKDWKNIWLDLIAWSAGFNVRKSGAGQLFIQKLQKENKRAIAVFDGLDEFIKMIQAENFKQQQKDKLITSFLRAINSLVSDIPAWLEQQQGRPLGVIIFIRNDLIYKAFSGKYENILSRYSPYELKWSPENALQFVFWIFMQCVPNQKTDFKSLSKSELATELLPLWGRKSNTEILSHEFFLQILLDSKGHVSPLNILKFLKIAVKESLKLNIFADSVLAPSSIDQASRNYIKVLSQKQDNIYHLLSDGLLYTHAVEFIQKNHTVDNTLMDSLEKKAEQSTGFSEFVDFIRQKKDEHLDENGKIVAFLMKLEKFCDQLLEDNVKSDRDFIPENLNESQLQEYVEFFGWLFIKEFIHHLAAENRYRSEE